MAERAAPVQAPRWSTLGQRGSTKGAAAGEIDYDVAFDKPFVGRRSTGAGRRASVAAGSSGRAPVPDVLWTVDLDLRSTYIGEINYHVAFDTPFVILEKKKKNVDDDEVLHGWPSQGSQGYYVGKRDM